MNGLRFVVFFEPSTYKGVGSVNSMNEGTDTLNHPLIDELLKRLVKGDEAHVE